mgnify:CR=1 FL=1
MTLLFDQLQRSRGENDDIEEGNIPSSKSFKGVCGLITHKKTDNLEFLNTDLMWRGVCSFECCISSKM